MEFPFTVEIADMTPALLLDLLEDDLNLDGYTFRYFVPEEQFDPKYGTLIPSFAGESHREEVLLHDDDGATVAGISVLRLRLNTVRLNVYGVTADQDAADQFAAALEAVLVDIGVMNEPGKDGETQSPVEDLRALVDRLKPLDSRRPEWKRQVRDWYLGGGKDRSTQSEMAEAFGLSESTISRAVKYARK